MSLLQNAEAHWLVRLERHASLLRARAVYRGLRKHIHRARNDLIDQD